MPKEHFSYTLSDLKNKAQDILQQAAKSGASDCEVEISEGFGQSVTVRLGEVETIEHNRDKGIGVTVYVGKQKGYASTSDFSTQGINDTIAAALSIARLTQADEFSGLAESALLARGNRNIDLDLYHPWSLTVQQAIDLAKACEAAALGTDSHIKNSEGANVATQTSQFVAANSHGFMGGFPHSRHSISCAVIAGLKEEMQRDDWFSTGRIKTSLARPEVIGRYAAQRALSRLGSRKIPTCQVPVLFEAPLATGLISNFVSAVSGGNLYRKTSFLLNSLGKHVFSSVVDIAEEPHLKRGLASSYFDDDGVATKPRKVVERGIVQGYFLSVYSARKLGMTTTANAGGSHNLIVKPGNLDFKGLLRKMDRGLLVTELIGQGINFVTGDYSRGAVGFWVEKGEIQYPVHEITIAGNLKDIFKNIVAIGNDVVIRGAKQCGSILIENMTVAGE